MSVKDWTPKQKTSVKALIVALIGVVGAFWGDYVGIASWIGSLVGNMF
jgi:uncharacterized membrane protein